ncbi:HNH endonuclease signature motif containing protein [Neobacillus sp. PS3-40]|uniref:HNH endonuclease n=1 Tax=Neobacillus sp. PS3-40 TaxID=3070679 RepID=UPI0027E0EF7A|nr:HNH endonuclease signature motif containing protein [Neobacillus sp. PS3-40]WML42642.1 HNH endonuclease signature motif containing protein [Neobacillus sp. PS3-40]
MVVDINTPVKLKFRNATPIKRVVEYDADSNYKKYRSFLKEDFNGRCGYCDSPFGIVKKDYHIDHFIPQFIINKFPTHLNLLNDYSNLVYSCPSCNGSKSDKWPSEHPDIPFLNEEGFINPCSELYDSLFYRDEKGAIYPKEKLKTAAYIFKELKLYLRKHQTVWKIEELISLSKKAINEETSDSRLESIKELLGYLEEHFEMEIN